MKKRQKWLPSINNKIQRNNSGFRHERTQKRRMINDHLETQKRETKQIQIHALGQDKKKAKNMEKIDCAKSKEPLKPKSIDLKEYYWITALINEGAYIVTLRNLNSARPKKTSTN